MYDFRVGLSNLLAFSSSFCGSDWENFYAYENVNQCVNRPTFYNYLNKAMSQFPLSFVKFSPKTKSWITPVVIDLSTSVGVPFVKAILLCIITRARINAYSTLKRIYKCMN